MATSRPIELNVDATFSDDIRQETSGKITVVGVLDRHAYLPKFPAALPQLWVRVRVTKPRRKTVKKMAINVFLDDEQIFEQKVDTKTLKGLQSHNSRLQKDAFNVQFGFSPFPVKKESILRVVARLDSLEFLAGELSFEKKSE